MFNDFLLAVQVVFFVIGAYQVILSFFGWHRKRERITHKPTKSFALLVAAHKEHNEKKASVKVAAQHHGRGKDKDTVNLAARRKTEHDRQKAGTHRVASAK